MGRGAKFFKLLASEDIDGDEMDLSMTVLAGFGGTHVDNLAGAALDDHMSVLAKGGTLHRERGRGARIGRLESMLMLPSSVSAHRVKEWTEVAAKCRGNGYVRQEVCLPAHRPP